MANTKTKTIYTVSIDYNSYTSENLAHALCHEHLSSAKLYVAIIRSIWNGKSYDATTIGYGARIGDTYGVDLTVSAQATEGEKETIAQWIEPIETALYTLTIDNFAYRGDDLEAVLGTKSLNRYVDHVKLTRNSTTLLEGANGSLDIMLAIATQSELDIIYKWLGDLLED